MPDPINILIVDDHSIVREGLRLIFETVSDFEVIGEAGDGVAALELMETLQPDVILMDLRMPRMDGLTTIKTLQKTHPKTAIIILTTFNEDELMLQGLKAGARGYLLKDTDRVTLVNTIKAAARGEMLLSPDIMGRVLAVAENKPNSGTRAGISLTAREQEVLHFAADGKTSKEIAFQLEITERTVKAHLTSIYNKLGVDSRAAAVATAAKKGWLDGDG